MITDSGIDIPIQSILDRLGVVYLITDLDLHILSASKNVSQLGYTDIEIGADATDSFDFMVGLNPREELQLPVVSTPSGVPVSIYVVPFDEDKVSIFLNDASTLFEYRQQLQQKANENELLLKEQHKLMHELRLVHNELVHKNSELEEAARLQNSFFSGVSHEFRTPLSSIIGYTDLLQKQAHNVSIDGDRTDVYLSAVQRSSKHLLSLVENLLDHGKLDSGEIIINPKPTKLNSVLEDVALLLKPLAMTKGITLNVNQIASKEDVFFVDDSRLRQCLINLVGNAVKFTDEGSVTVDATIDDQWLNVTVMDTGLGIKPEDLEKVRLPFWQAANTGKAGTGLGLTITERIIELMGGSLDIESTPNEGTKVRFKLPVVAAAEIEQETTLVAADIEQAMKILLVEDDNDIADLAMILLQERGINVVRAENGQMALDLVGCHQFDLLLMDIHMPVLDGFSTTQAIRESGNQTPIIVMSASAIEADREKANALGCDGYLVKPVEVDDIIRIANDVVASQNDQLLVRAPS